MTILVISTCIRILGDGGSRRSVHFRENGCSELATFGVSDLVLFFFFFKGIKSARHPPSTLQANHL